MLYSQAKYHEDFNKSKGKFTVVADDPAVTRAKEHQRIVSQAEYTGKRKDSSSQILSHGNFQKFVKEKKKKRNFYPKIIMAPIEYKLHPNQESVVVNFE